MASIYVIRFTLQDEGLGDNTQTVVSIANAIEIQASIAIYSILAVALTVWDNHCTAKLFHTFPKSSNHRLKFSEYKTWNVICGLGNRMRIVWRLKWFVPNCELYNIGKTKFRGAKLV